MWDTRYRPLRFADVLGQEGNIKLLKSRLKNGTAFDTSYIFAGAFGRGKTTLSRIHARAMLCQNLDTSDPEPCNECDSCAAFLAEQVEAFVERDAASQGTIDHIRAIVEELPYALAGVQKRIYLFDEAHRMSIAAQDVLLKPVEEKRMVGMFCTTEANKIRGAIRSRCEEYTIRKVSRDEILSRMRMVLEKENVEFQDDAVLIVIDHSGGHVRDVLNKLEMISQIGPVITDTVREYLHLPVISLFYKILLSLDNPVQALEYVDQVCEQVAPEEVASGIAEAAMNTYRLAHKMHADFAFVDRELAQQVYERYKDAVVKFAFWFLNSRYPSKLSLTRDVVVFSQTPNNLPLENPSPPVVFAGAASSATPVPASDATAVSVTSVKDAPSTEKPKSSVKATSVDYVELLTDLERDAASIPMPRTRRNGPAPVVGDSKARPQNMSAAEWRSRFEYLFRKKSPVLLPE